MTSDLSSRHFRKGFIWNMAASITYSAMSVIFLWLVVRVGTPEAGGIFSITFSNAQMLQAIGYFGVRNYQVTDLKPEFPFSVYLSSRVLSLVMMGSACLLYEWAMGYAGEKQEVFWAFCLTKVVEAAADLFEGLMQQQERLDLAGKAWMARSVLALVGFSAVLWITGELRWAAWAMLGGTFLGTLLFAVVPARRFSSYHFSFSKKEIGRLMVQSLPLFLSTGLLLYINNAPKIAIDQYLSYEIQTKFNIIFMPVFVINLVCSFLFRPLLIKMAQSFQEDRASFIKLNQKLFLGIFVVSCFILLGAYLLGIPVLSWVYGVDLKAFRWELMVLIVGGGFCAAVNFFSQILTVMRNQWVLLLAYVIVSLAVLFLSSLWTSLYQMMGASLSYTVAMGLLTVFLWSIYRYKIQKDRRSGIL